MDTLFVFFSPVRKLLLLYAGGTLSTQNLHLLPQPERVEQRTAPPF